MNKKFLTIALLSSFVMAGATAPVFAKDSRQVNTSAASAFDDTGITAAIKAKQAADSTVRASAISVETVKGVVQLSGFTSSAAEKARAEEIARSVEGVKSVRNDIQLKATNAQIEKQDGKSTASRVIEDSAITAAIKAKQAEDPVVRASSIGVETVRGVVQLSGFTASEREKARAEELARTVEGVKLVRNDVVIRK